MVFSFLMFTITGKMSLTGPAWGRWSCLDQSALVRNEGEVTLKHWFSHLNHVVGIGGWEEKQFPREGWRILFLKRQNNRFQPYFQISFLTVKAPLLFPYTTYCFLPLSFLPTPPSCFIYKTLSLLFQEDPPASVLCYQLHLYKYLN